MKNNELPAYASAFPLGSARIREIKALENELAKCEHGQRVFQRLPRHMQRRAVSRNPQRLPRTLQEKHKREIGILKTNKRPSRKYRRRPSNLLAEYNRRQRNNVWLETHIWHAKRFCMLKSWGYVIPKTPTAKCYRSSIRAATESCLIQDVSYENCIECEGPIAELTETLRKIVCPEDMMALFDTNAVNGQSWTNIMLYFPDKSPMEAIGNAQLIWIPSGYIEVDNLRQFWIWVHPSIYEDVRLTLNHLFDLELIVEDRMNSTHFGPISDFSHLQESKLSCRNVPWNRVPKFKSKHHNDIKVSLLKDTLNKFRLIGPKSYDILRKAIISSSVIFNNENNNAPESKKDSVLPMSVDWWKTVFSNPINVQANKEQVSFWESLSPTLLNSKQIINLVIRDPRLILPCKKQTIAAEDSQRHSIKLPEHHHPAEIFNPKIRDCVTFSMKSTHDINTMRSKLLVPGTIYPLTEEETRIPVLLLYRQSSHVSGLGSGWEVILPCGWGMPTWLALILNGAVAGGQDEVETLMEELLMQPLPQFLPDTKAGRSYSSVLSKYRETEYFKRPQSSRLNFIKLGIKNPFKINWEELINYWNEETNNYFVLRDKQILKSLALLTCKKIETIKRNIKRKRNAENIEDQPKPKHCKTDHNEILQSTRKEVISKLQLPGNSLIYVRIVLLTKGNIQPLAMICMPTADDLNEMLTTSVNTKTCNILEPIHEDTNNKIRKELKEKHLKNLKCMQRKRKKARSNVLNGEDDPLKSFPSIKEALVASVLKVEENEKELMDEIGSYNKKMNKLWVQLENEESRIPCYVRSIFGYVTSGGFCIRMGRSGGIGWVVAKPFLALLKNESISWEKETPCSGQKHPNFESRADKSISGYGFKENIGLLKQVYVLVRNPSSLQYLWARLIVLNI